MSELFRDVIGVGMGWPPLTGDVYDVGGILRCPKGIDPSAPVFAGRNTRTKISTPDDHTALSSRTHTEIKEAICG